MFFNRVSINRKKHYSDTSNYTVLQFIMINYETISIKIMSSVDILVCNILLDIKLRPQNTILSIGIHS